MMMNVPTERGRPPRTAPGVQESVRAMYVDHGADVFAYLARRVGSDLADDLLAEAFRLALESYARYDAARGSERVWLYGIASNVLRHHWRSERRHLVALQRSGGQSNTTVDPLLAVLDRVDVESQSTRLLQAVAELEPIDRDVLLLRCWEELSAAEVAAALDMTSGGVRTRLHRVRAQLRGAIDNAHNDHPERRTE
jgi:RNA polymerase sigma-70 factor (ECF subfamily)